MSAPSEDRIEILRAASEERLEFQVRQFPFPARFMVDHYCDRTDEARAACAASQLMVPLAAIGGAIGKRFVVALTEDGRDALADHDESVSGGAA